MVIGPKPAACRRCLSEPPSRTCAVGTDSDTPLSKPPVQAINHHIGNPHVVHAYLSPSRLERDVAANFVRVPKRAHRKRKVTRQEESPITPPQSSCFCHICTSAAIRMQKWCQRKMKLGPWWVSKGKAGASTKPAFFLLTASSPGVSKFRQVPQRPPGGPAGHPLRWCGPLSEGF